MGAGGWMGVTGGQRGATGGVEGWGLGRNPRVRKPEREPWCSGGAWWGMVGGEGPRVIEHNTRQLMAAPGFFFCSHFKGGFAADWFKKGI